MRVLIAASLLIAGLAGCAGAPGSGQDDFENLNFGVQATETTGIIRGVVVDEAIRPLAGVLINITGTASPRGTVTRDDGSFGFQGLEPGDYFLLASRDGFLATQGSTTVVAGNNLPPLVKITLTAVPVAAPYVEPLSFTGFLSFGAAVGITSVGTTINQQLSEILQDQSIWYLSFTQLPTWAQGELVWEHNQPAGGMLIWEMTDTTNAFHGYRETAESPALAYWNTTVLIENRNTTLDPDMGIAYRFFGGPHPALAPASAGGTVLPPEEQCPWIPTIVLGDRNPCRFGYGITTQQRADAFVHHFYNFAPPEGWRFTVDGDPIVPTA